MKKKLYYKYIVCALLCHSAGVVPSLGGQTDKVQTSL